MYSALLRLDKFKETAEVTNDIKANRKLRIGFIGTGGIARSHVKAYKLFDDVEIAAGADIIPGKARKFFDDWERNIFDSHGIVRLRRPRIHCSGGRNTLRRARGKGKYLELCLRDCAGLTLCLYSLEINGLWKCGSERALLFSDAVHRVVAMESQRGRNGN